MGFQNFHAVKFVTYSKLNGPSTLTSYIRILVDEISSILNSIKNCEFIDFLSVIHSSTKILRLLCAKDRGTKGGQNRLSVGPQSCDPRNEKS